MMKTQMFSFCLVFLGICPISYECFRNVWFGRIVDDGSTVLFGGFGRNIRRGYASLPLEIMMGCRCRINFNVNVCKCYVKYFLNNYLEENAKRIM